MSEKSQTIEPAWQLEEVIAETVDAPPHIARNVVTLLEEGATIPFIARYRKERTGGMEADKLREINSLLNELKCVQSKLTSVFNAIDSMGKMHHILASALRQSRSVSEIEHLYAPFKPGHKGSLAERARKLGLEFPAMEILDGKYIEMTRLVKTGEKGLDTPHDVENGIKHILADVISKDKDVMTEVRIIYQHSGVKLASCRSKSVAADSVKVKSTKKVKVEEKKFPMKPDDTYKFEQYFDYSILVKYIKSHQVMAINRGEDKKILTVKIVVPDYAKSRLVKYCSHRFIKNRSHDSIKALIGQSINDAYDRLIQPQMCRHIRSELTKSAERDSIKVFAANLNRLLLAPPVRGKTVLGIDPGFKHGCKMAVVSHTGVILSTHVLYFLDFRSNAHTEKKKLIDIVNTHRCEVIAIGNGVACRQTEQFVTDIIQMKSFWQSDVVYCIVDESGASIYSVSDEAKRELPNLDATLRGAVSIARRLQDPLAELVKIEPKHIGVGMYQHDIAEAKLKTSLDSVVEECVSFVGVDINTGSECLLRRIAGLNTTKAKKILEWRETHGAFANREQLLGIKGFGQKGYEQCAGFIRVVHDFSDAIVRGKSEVKTEEPVASATGRKRKAGGAKGPAKKKKKAEASSAPNPLDMTAIHPESYHIAHRLLSDIGVDAFNIGQDSFCERVRKFIKEKDIEGMASQYDTGVHTLTQIMDALQRSLLYDIRDKYDKPLFKKEVMSMKELKCGQTLTGRVMNVTHFGAFVDVGVGQTGLIHCSKMREGLEGRQGVELGDNVNVEVISVEVARGRIGLKLLGFTR